MSNAAKFTPAEGRIGVSLCQHDGRAVLEVADSGIGIDPETLKGLFVPFVQADRTLDRSKGGLGLGLALVKMLAELHGGEIRAQSGGIGRGARFTLELPLAAPAPRTRVETPQEPNEVGRRVLIIEDNKDAADSLAEALELSGCRVAVAYAGEEGLARAREFRPDIVLGDIGLPDGLDGYAVARALRQDPAMAATLLVALTGYAQPEDQRRALEAGFDAHLAKPPDLAALQQLIGREPNRRDLPTTAEISPG